MINLKKGWTTNLAVLTICFIVVVLLTTTTFALLFYKSGSEINENGYSITKANSVVNVNSSGTVIALTDASAYVRVRVDIKSNSSNELVQEYLKVISNMKVETAPVNSTAQWLYYNGYYYLTNNNGNLIKMSKNINYNLLPSASLDACGYRAGLTSIDLGLSKSYEIVNDYSSVTNLEKTNFTEDDFIVETLSYNGDLSSENTLDQIANRFFISNKSKFDKAVLYYMYTTNSNKVQTFVMKNGIYTKPLSLYGYNIEWSCDNKPLSNVTTFEASGIMLINATSIVRDSAYKIVLDSQDATEVGTNILYQKYNTGYFLDENCTVGTSSIAIPQKSGCIFKGYYTKVGGIGTKYIDSAGVVTTDISEDITLYACWKMPVNLSFGGTSSHTVQVSDISISGALSIPSYVKLVDGEYIEADEETGRAITGIADNGFSDCTLLTSVVLPETITYIGVGAFSGCTNLKKIELPSGVKYIGQYAFSNCGALESVTIEGKVPTLPQGSFNGCSSLSSIILPDGIETIGKYAFSGCVGPTTIIIPNTVTKVEDYAFSGCSGLITMIIPSSVTEIANGLFQDCSGLKNLTIEGNITSIGGHAFDGCSSLLEIAIPSSVTSIGSYAFHSCNSLTDVIVGGTNSWTVAGSSKVATAQTLTSYDGYRNSWTR